MILLFYLLSIFIHKSFGGCPPGTIQGLNSAECFQFFASSTNWVAAEKQCTNFGGHLTSISSSFENVFLINITQTVLYNFTSAWIGANSLFSPGTWSWSDNSQFTYINWGTGQPTGTQGLCATLSSSTGKWSSLDCSSLTFPYICKYNGTADTGTCTCPTTTPSLSCPTPSQSSNGCTSHSGNCQQGYTYFNTTNYCYKLYTTNQSIGLNSSRNICLGDGGDLVSIHSTAENLFVSSFIDQLSEPSWLGLIYQNSQWRWLDGTPYDYYSWMEGYPINGWTNCAVYDTPGCPKTGCDWSNNYNCTTGVMMDFAAFDVQSYICKHCPL